VVAVAGVGAEASLRHQDTGDDPIPGKYAKLFKYIDILLDSEVLLFYFSDHHLALALLRIPDHTEGGTIIGLIPGLGAAHDQDLVPITGEEGGECRGGRQIHSYTLQLMKALYYFYHPSRSYSPGYRNYHGRKRSRSPFSNRKRHDGNRVSKHT